MECRRCGGRMLSRLGATRHGLVCSDCGTPVSSGRPSGKPHPLSSSLTLLAFGAFSILLFLLTNWRPKPPEHASERGLLKQVTTGEFVRETPLLEKGSRSLEP